MEDFADQCGDDRLPGRARASAARAQALPPIHGTRRAPGAPTRDPFAFERQAMEAIGWRWCEHHGIAPRWPSGRTGLRLEPRQIVEVGPSLRPPLVARLVLGAHQHMRAALCARCCSRRRAGPDGSSPRHGGGRPARLKRQTSSSAPPRNGQGFGSARSGRTSAHRVASRMAAPDPATPGPANEPAPPPAAACMPAGSSTPAVRPVSAARER